MIDRRSYLPNNFDFICDTATSIGFFSLFGLSSNSPEQLGQIEPNSSLQGWQKVHSNEHIYAASRSPVEALHFSQAFFILSIWNLSFEFITTESSRAALRRRLA
jgi:hypothetical protein